MRILGIDPGLQRTGWGVIESTGHKLTHISHGVIATDSKADMSERLLKIFDGLTNVITLWQPDTAAIEEIFVNSNSGSSLKLGLARGVAMVAPAKIGLSVAEYTANMVKKSVVGAGHADKTQVQAMIKILLNAVVTAPDAADALAVAICHASHAATKQKLGGILSGGAR
jgi:crossover junction endodeoxyribonuclease RuvC